MSGVREAILAIFLALIASASIAQSQNQPRIGYVFPAGGRKGTTLEVTIGGQFLAGVSGAVFSGENIKASVLEHIRPLNAKELNLLRDKVQELQQKRTTADREPSAPRFTPEDEAEMAKARHQLATRTPQRLTTPAISEKVRVSIEIGPEAKPGEREVRLLTPRGLSNPMRFQISTLAECAEPVKEAGPPFRAGNAQRPLSPPRQIETPIKLPCVINGRIEPSDIDRYRFRGEHGHQIVFVASTRGLIPYIADAVPGWLQATLTIRDKTGRELGFSEGFRFNVDPVLEFEPPADDDYILEVRDALYRGRDDFVYRIVAGEIPFATSIFPLGGPRGAPTTVRLTGWNLPVQSLVVPGTATNGIHWLSPDPDSAAYNRLPFITDDLPETPADRAGTPGSGVTGLPATINGIISKPGEADTFRIRVNQGESLVAEVQARRLGSPLDSILQLSDESGKLLAENDDFEDPGRGLLTHQADSLISYSFPQAGTYRVVLRDGQGKGGPDYAYRLRLSLPEPDFALRLTPSSLNIRPGGSCQATLTVLPKRGFTNDIELRFADPIIGLFMQNTRIPGGQKQVKITFNARRGLGDRVQTVHLVGTARVGGKELVREVEPADDQTQAFSYHHLVPAQELKLGVMEAPLRGRPNVR
jgi:hypothetical protein